MVDHQYSEKIKQAENMLVHYNSLNRNKLLRAERLIDILIKKSNSFSVNDSVKILKELRSSGNSTEEKVLVSQLLFNDLEINENLTVFDEITYTVNVFLSLWQKTNDGYAKVYSNEPSDPMSQLAFLNDTIQIIKEIENGQKPIRNIYLQDDSKLIKSIPIIINGDTKLFIDIIVYEYLHSLISRLYSDSHEHIIVFNSEGKILFQKKDIESESAIDEKELMKFKFLKRKSLIKEHFNDHKIYYSYIPSLGFFIAYVIPKDFYENETKQANLYILLIISISLIAIILFVVLTYLKIKRVEKKHIQYIQKIISDYHHNEVDYEEDLRIENAFSYLFDYDKDIYSYIKALADGSLSKDFLFAGTKNKTVKSLIKLKERLEISLKNEQKREKEEELNRKLEKGRNEITELLRYVTDINELSFSILKNSAEFLNIQQGGMFVLDNTNPEEPVMEMIASYAYDKKKFASKRIPLDDGLVGRAYLERQNIYLTEIPENYTLIESGFGNMEPKSLLIVPLIFNNDVQAVIELASIYEIEDYKIKFIESIGESIASTISNLKQTNQTNELLQQTQKQSKEIEEQRKTLEEKINTHRKQNRNLDKEILQLIEIIESIKSITYMVEYDLKGFIVDASRKTLEVLDAQRGDLITKHHKHLVVDKNYDKTYENFWDELQNNKAQYITEKVLLKDKEVKLSQSYVPIRNTRRKIYRILSVGSIIN
jgi:PAS domain-containing protein